MVFSVEDRILIENLYKKLIREFPDKGWNVRGLNYLLKKLRDTVTTARQPGSGRRRSARRPTDENVDVVNNLVLSKEGAPKMHQTTRQIARETGIHHSSVYRIVRKDLQLKCLKKHCDKLRVTPDSCEEAAASVPCIRCGLHLFH